MIEICNYGACSYPEVTIQACEDTDSSATVNTGLEETERNLQENDLEEALQIMVALGEAELTCADVEVIFFLFLFFHFFFFFFFLFSFLFFFFLFGTIFLTLFYLVFVCLGRTIHCCFSCCC